MKIDWSALGSVFGVSLAVTVGLVALFTLGVMGLSHRERATAQGGSAALATAGAYVAFAGCAAAVAYGINLIMAKG
ncbi:hypothetical protein ACWCQ1_05235 [Streptomyces sp. NPDC002144]|jgi:hypothetical protein|uniref:hypothetical protein n=1 Tax=Streptomyces TaxID=1883 RepID=UPI00105623AC|nr:MULTISPECIES: hypothetical protein [Streptomyces]MBO4260556.1 hypothetical protein [Streptomyces griseorubiginosus]MCH5673061.1 hypothetical protein [Streptomyces sp. CME 23]